MVVQTASVAGVGVIGAGAEIRRLRERAGGRPLAIAHRAGNEIETLHQAEDLGADLIEIDVWDYRGRLEVRHAKTLGPVILWDRSPRDLPIARRLGPLSILTDHWHVRLARSHSRQTIADIYRAAQPRTNFMLDLKGRSPRLAERLVAAVRQARPTPAGESAPPILICARNWTSLEAAGRHPDVRVIHSVGDEDELAAVWDRLAPVPDPAVSVHARLLDEPTLARLVSTGIAVISWPINTQELREDLTARGASGLTIDEPDVLRAVLAGKAGHRDPVNW
jgi:glycerophosphoryl diester phosphodiesterase